MSVETREPSYLFFKDTATTEIYTLSLHDALPIFVPMLFIGTGNGLVLPSSIAGAVSVQPDLAGAAAGLAGSSPDRKSPRLNSSDANIPYVVFCLDKKHQH